MEGGSTPWAPRASQDIRLRQEAPGPAQPGQDPWVSPWAPYVPNTEHPAEPQQAQPFPGFLPGQPGQPIYHYASKPPGYKIRVGDIAPHVDNTNVYDAIEASLEQLGAPVAFRFREHLAQIDTIGGRSASGASYTTITVSTPEAARCIFDLCYKWKMGVDLPGHPYVEGRTFSTKWLGQIGKGKSGNRFAGAGKGIGGSAPLEHGSVSDARAAFAPQSTLHLATRYQSTQEAIAQPPGTGHPRGAAAAAAAAHPPAVNLAQPVLQPPCAPAQPGAGASAGELRFSNAELSNLLDL